MAAASLEGVWAKLARAQEHHDLLEQEVRDFIEQDPQPIGLSIPYLDTESGWHVCLAIAREPPPPRLGVLLGDLLHNVRSALDHLVRQLVILNEETPRAGGRGNDYPLAMTEHEWRTAEGSSLRGVAEEHRATIQITQPYRAGPGAEDTIPGHLRRLSDVDKHQVVHPTLAVILDPGERLTARVTRGPGTVTHTQFRPFGSFEHGTELVRVRVEPLTPDTEVVVDGEAEVGMAFGERRVPAHIALQILEAAKVIAREFEPAFR